MIRALFGFFIRDARQTLSYKVALLLDIAKVVFKIATFYFVAKMIVPATGAGPGGFGGDYFPFVLVGIAFATFQSTGLTAFSQSLRQEQYLGTLESILSTPLPMWLFLAGSALWDFFYATVEVALYFLLAFLMVGLVWPNASFGLAVLSTALTLFSFMGLGVLAAAFILRYKKGNPIMLFLSTGGELLGGVYFPIDLLPPWLKAIAQWMPMNHALAAVRGSLITGASFADIQNHLVYLFLFTIAAWAGGLGSFYWALKKSRNDGTLAHY